MYLALFINQLLKKIIFLSLFLVPLILKGQNTDLIFKGRVVDAETGIGITSATVINKRTSQGIAADNNGRFTIAGMQGDTIKIYSLGYELIHYPLTSEKEMIIRLAQKIYQLRPFEFKAPRDYGQIKEDIATLKPVEYKLKGITAFASPISALYERFSKMEKSKRTVAALENEDIRRDALRDLLSIYVKADIIDLPEDQFDKFISYLNFSDEFILTSSQYDLIMAIKERYQLFRKNNEGGDYYNR